MLRGMVLKNFVNFKERYLFDFSKIGNGPYIFVGASSTGKTAALELIRRCMGDKLISSLTNRCNPNEIAYVFCEFYTDIPEYGSTVITGIIVEKTDNERKEQDCAIGGEQIDSKDETKTMFHMFIDDDNTSTNYDTACSQAEIITTLMGDSLVNEETEACILNVLTAPTKFHFRRNPKCDVKHDNRELVSKESSAEVKKEKKTISSDFC